MTQIILPLPPSVNRLWRTKPGGGVYRSPKYAEWRNAAIWQASVQIKSQKIEGPFAIRLAFVRPDKRRRDLDNLIKAAMDVIVTVGLVEDDCLCERIEAYWAPEGPQCLIEVIGG